MKNGHEQESMKMEVENLWRPQMSKRMLPNERPTSISYLDERFFIEIKMAAFLNFNKKQWRNRSSKFDNNGYNLKKLN